MRTSPAWVQVHIERERETLRLALGMIALQVVSISSKPRSPSDASVRLGGRSQEVCSGRSQWGGH